MPIAAGIQKSYIVPCATLQETCKDAGIHSIDYLSLDTEGSEMEILRMWDPTALPIDVITIENNYQSDIRSFLAAKGYEFLINLSGDEVYRFCG